MFRRLRNLRKGADRRLRRSAQFVKCALRPELKVREECVLPAAKFGSLFWEVGCESVEITSEVGRQIRFLLGAVS